MTRADGRAAAIAAAAVLRAVVAVRLTTLAPLLRAPTGVPRLRPDDDALAHQATAMAFVALHRLRRLRAWRSTCLFRAVAECLILRALGRPAVLRLGVARRGAAADVTAHAWAECPGHRCLSADGGEGAAYRPLHGSPA